MGEEVGLCSEVAFAVKLSGPREMREFVVVIFVGQDMVVLRENLDVIQTHKEDF